MSEIERPIDSAVIGGRGGPVEVASSGDWQELERVHDRSEVGALTGRNFGRVYLGGRS